jgi:hypothetical protein
VETPSATKIVTFTAATVGSAPRSNPHFFERPVRSMGSNFASLDTDEVSPAHLTAYTDLKPGLLSTARSTTCGLRGRHSRSLPTLRTAPHGLCGKGTRCPLGSSSDACLDSRRSPPDSPAVWQRGLGAHGTPQPPVLRHAQTFVAAGVTAHGWWGSGARAPEPQSGTRGPSPLINRRIRRLTRWTNV